MFYLNTKSKKKTYYLILILGGISLLLSNLNHIQAQSNIKIEEKLSQTQAELRKLFEIKDSTEISQEEKERLEKELRFKIISKIIETSQIQLEDLKQNWEKIPNFPLSEDWQKIKNSFLRKIDESQNYWKEKQLYLKEKEEITIKDLKELAKNIEEEKKTQIDPLIEQSSEIFMVFELTEILKIANQRLEKVKNDLNKIYSKKVTKNPTLKTLLNQATNYLEQAQQNNDKAKELILYLYDTQEDKIHIQNLIEEIEKQLKKSKNQENFSLQEKGRTYIKELTLTAFEKVKSSYELFLKMSSLVKQMII